MPTDDPPTPQHNIFVHDFSPIDRPYPHASEVFVAALTPETVSQVVRQACVSEGIVPTPWPAPWPTVVAFPLVALGAPRWREDAVVVPLAWEFPTVGGLVLDADLELAAYTPSRCHLHLLGRVPLEAGMQPSTRGASLHGRRAVAVVRHLLTELAVLISRRDRSYQLPRTT